MCGFFYPFGSKTGYRFNHLGLKSSGKVCYTCKRGLELSKFFSRRKFYDENEVMVNFKPGD